MSGREVHDPGLQQERTVLAWDRTALAVMVASGLLQRSLGGPLLRPETLVPVGAFLLGMVTLVLDRPRYLSRWRRLQEGAGMLSVVPVLSVALATVILGVTAFVVAVSA